MKCFVFIYLGKLVVVNEVWTMSVNKSAESQTILEATITYVFNQLDLAFT